LEAGGCLVVGLAQVGEGCSRALYVGLIKGKIPAAWKADAIAGGAPRTR
jgi:hypothetical protein